MMSSTTGKAILVTGTIALTAIAGDAARAHAQVPQSFENLQVLPKDIARDSLLNLMKSFSFGLNVRCVYCHVGEDSPTLAGVDFKSDEKATKRTAREMLRMVSGINQTLDRMATRSSSPITVRCATCHQGKARPISLEDSVYRGAVTGGGKGGVAVYDSLREDYFGRSAYDFTFTTLVRVAERLYAERKYEDAVAILLRNAELYPRFWNNYYELGKDYEALNRKDDAIKAYQATLERLPNHAPSVERLRILTGG